MNFMFKPGDKVRCIKKTKFEENLHGKVGEIYTVKSCINGSLQLMELNKGEGGSDPTRFELVKELSKPSKKIAANNDWGF